AGGGAQAVFALTDAIYAPLAERQFLRARNLQVQTAKNDALLSVALAYFDVQQARGILAGTRDSVARAREVARRVGAMGRGLPPEQRPTLIASPLLQPTATPGERLGAGVYGTGRDSLNHWSGRSDWDAEVVWEFRNLGFGNRGLVTQCRGEQRQALVELFRTQ